MSCGSFGVTQVLIGLHRLGLVGLRDALEDAASSGLEDREALLDRIVGTLVPQNYIPDPESAALRRALWREYLRARGEDFREFFSEIDVTILGEPGAVRDRFEAMTRLVLGRFELSPRIAFAPPSEEGPQPQLAIDDRVIVRGLVAQGAFENAVRKSISDW